MDICPLYLMENVKNETPLFGTNTFGLIRNGQIIDPYYLPEL